MAQYINAEAQAYCAALLIVCPSISRGVAHAIYMAGVNAALQGTEMLLEGVAIENGPPPAL